MAAIDQFGLGSGCMANEPTKDRQRSCLGRQAAAAAVASNHGNE
jgi:hypothetical protein